MTFQGFKKRKRKTLKNPEKSIQYRNTYKGIIYGGATISMTVDFLFYAMQASGQ